MARAAVLGRLTWRSATLQSTRAETETARTLTWHVPGWAGHLPGQHVDLRLTAPDGYTAQRPYSIGSAPAEDTFDLTVEAASGGEVSPFLVEDARPGVSVEFRGPLGGWFVWRPEQPDPVQLIAGGSGLVPVMSMLRTHRPGHRNSEMRLLYSTRTPASMLYADELTEQPARAGETLDVVYTRGRPASHPRPPRRLDATDLARYVIPASRDPLCYVCGPTPFVEAVTAELLGQGHDKDRVRAERFGAGGT